MKAYNEAKKAYDEYLAQSGKVEPLAVKLSDSVGPTRLDQLYVDADHGFLVMFMQAGIRHGRNGIVSRQDAAHDCNEFHDLSPWACWDSTCAGICLHVWAGWGPLTTMGNYGRA